MLIIKDVWCILLVGERRKMTKAQVADETPIGSTGYNKRFEDLTFSDDYIFKLVMERAEIFEAFLKVTKSRILF